MEYLNLFLLLYHVVSFVVCNKVCEGDHNCQDERKNLYLKEVNQIYTDITQAIEKASKSYKPCNNTNCACFDDVLNNNLKTFAKGITEDMIESVRQKGTKYQIINKRLYRDKDCLFPSRCSGIEHFLLKLLPKLPDMELVINTRDWPQTYKDYVPFGPVFSFSKTSEHADIMYPAWSFWEGGPAISLYPTGLGRWDKHRKTISEAAEKYTWNKKLKKAFFRGSRTSAERDPLILLSREEPELVDAQYTKNQAWKSELDTLHASPAEEVSLEHHCRYKYLFNFRGVAASFRFKHLFLCKSLVFHVGNEWDEFFYTMLKPWVHYIPVNTHATKNDIKILLEYFQHHDSEAKYIAEKGYQIIWNNLKMSDVYCYWNKLLRRYSKLLKYKPKLEEDFIEIVKK